MVDDKANIVITSPVGSNLAGLCFPFVKDKIDGKNPDLESLP